MREDGKVQNMLETVKIDSDDYLEYTDTHGYINDNWLNTNDLGEGEEDVDYQFSSNSTTGVDEIIKFLNDPRIDNPPDLLLLRDSNNNLLIYYFDGNSELSVLNVEN